MKHGTDSNIVLVEDNQDLLEAHRDLFRSLSSRVVVARDGEEAARAVADAPGAPVDLLVVNAYPSRQTGVEIVDRVRSVRPDLPALLLSGFGDDREIRRRVALGHLDLLAMPFGLDELSVAVARTAAQRVALASRTTETHEAAAERPRPDAGSSDGRLRRGPWLGLAATVLLGLGLAWSLASSSAPALPAPDSAASRGARVELLGPDGELDSRPTVFSWVEAPGAESYRLVIRSVDGSVLWETETAANAVNPPADVLKELQEAVSYYWRVEASGARGLRVGRSHLVEFRIHPTVGEPSAFDG